MQACLSVSCGKYMPCAPCRPGTLAKLRFKLFGPIHNRWRLRRVLRTSPWRYYYDTIRAQWNERFTLFR